uniref:Uncharacterized protein n=1 Tax=Vespula pensylvanica TaxID=30213 RepID=A0A834PGI5_VESPE|nr:hypothetical protein H0235_001769 [Vespula pensylvanica]
MDFCRAYFATKFHSLPEILSFVMRFLEYVINTSREKKQTNNKKLKAISLATLVRKGPSERQKEKEKENEKKKERKEKKRKEKKRKEKKGKKERKERKKERNKARRIFKVPNVQCLERRTCGGGDSGDGGDGGDGDSGGGLVVLGGLEVGADG